MTHPDSVSSAHPQPHRGLWQLRFRSVGGRVEAGGVTPVFGPSEKPGKVFMVPVPVVACIVYTPEFHRLEDLCDALSLGRIVAALRITVLPDEAGGGRLGPVSEIGFGAAGLVTIEAYRRRISGWGLS